MDVPTGHAGYGTEDDLFPITLHHVEGGYAYPLLGFPRGSLVASFHPRLALTEPERSTWAMADVQIRAVTACG